MHGSDTELGFRFVKNSHIIIHEARGRSTVWFDNRRLLLPEGFKNGDTFDPKKHDIPPPDPNKRDKARRFLISQTLISETKANALVKPLARLVPLKHFRVVAYASIVIMLVMAFAFIFLSSQASTGSTSASTLIIAYFGIVVVLALHELGHGAAAHALGIRIDTIGAGVYLLFPALFTRLSLVTLLSPYERVIVYAMGPIYQAGATTLLFILFCINPSPAIQFICVLSIFSFFLNLVPVLHLDGYRINKEILRYYRHTEVGAWLTRGSFLIAIVLITGAIVFLSFVIWNTVALLLITPNLFLVLKLVFYVILLMFFGIAAPRWMRKPNG